MRRPDTMQPGELAFFIGMCLLIGEIEPPLRSSMRLVALVGTLLGYAAGEQL